MSIILSPRDRQALGLKDKFPGRSVTLVPLEPSLATGRSNVAFDESTIPAEFLLDDRVQWAEVFYDPFSDLGLTARAARPNPEEDSLWVEITHASIFEIEYRGALFQPPTVIPHPVSGRQGDDTKTFVRLTPARPVSIIVDDGAAVLLQVEGEELTLVPYGRIEMAPTKSPSIPIEASTWIGTTLHDPWLHQELTERFAFDDAWESAVAVGMYARLLEPDPRNMSNRLAKLRHDWRDEELERPIRWIRSLQRQQVDALGRLADAEAVDLLGRISDLDAEMKPGEELWQHEFLELCHARDDLEGVCVLLSYVDPPVAATRCSDAVDDAGGLLVASIPFELVLESERLRRVRCKDPDAWWARMAADD